ncbi:MAG: lactate dehydrogenase [Betaproteobacteria bacterium RIFCSPLOWO2_12_FULL_62_13]|nr:MAG: lactate dehydrogenase [Betaproteobacteria bacterium RIFCSPLOWO2_12_FULL_62_13]
MLRSIRPGDPAFAARLKRELQGEVLFDAASRGRYSTDASIYQIEPLGVVVPRTEEDALVALQIALQDGVPVLARGGGTSQCGQTVGAALVIDNSKHLNQLVAFDKEARRVTVQPGVVLDQLNAHLKQHGLWFPVDVSTSAQATIGGMAGNNSCGSRSIEYGNMVHNVHAIDAVLADGSQFRFGAIPGDLSQLPGPKGYIELVKRIRGIAVREAEEIEHRYPKLLRRVGGYNLDMMLPAPFNMAHLLVGSEGTLAYSKRLHLKCSPLPKHKTLGVCHFPTFSQSMEAPQQIVKLKPTAVELVDRTMIELARGNPAFQATVDRFIKGDPDAILLVEFAGDERDEQLRKLRQLVELMGDLGFPGGVVEITDPALQRDVWEVRKAGLNIMMSMKGDGKPVSFIEDCAVPLEHLAEYTDRLTRVFEKHGTQGTWYAHASVGCLHVRPVLNMREDGAQKMRAIAEEAAELVKRYKGAYSGEHGDGLARSEWIAPFFGPRLVSAFEEIKDIFDPKGLLNPGKIVRPAKQDDRTLFRFRPGYRIEKMKTALDWSELGGFDKAVEMCNNNGHCRKFDAGVMCPSYRVTREEQHLTRGRANTLRLALSGQLGPGAFTSDELYETLDLCVSCKGCKRECPTGVDMAKMKVEFLHHYRQRHGLTLKDRLIAYLPRYAPWAARFSWVMNLRDRVPGLAALSEKLLGFSAKRTLPQWNSNPFHTGKIPSLSRGASAGWGVTRTSSPPSQPSPIKGEGASGEGAQLDIPSPLRGEGEGGGETSREVVLFVDTFNNYFEPANARAALQVLQAAGYTVHLPHAAHDLRPLCCGRTFLACGLVDEAKAEARRVLEALGPYVEHGVAVVGLEPSCLFGLRDEFLSMLPGGETAELALNALLFEEFIAREVEAGRFKLNLKPLPQKKALLHGHCHQKAFAAMPAVQKVLSMIPELKVEVIESSCCGMAGGFGFDAEHYDVSMKMAELSLLPKVRAADAETLLIADGTSCRHQIHGGARREALHVAQVLKQALTTY